MAELIKALEPLSNDNLAVAFKSTPLDESSPFASITTGFEKGFPFCSPIIILDIDIG